MKTVLRFYKKTFSTLLFFLFGPGCRFQPTCSEYAAEAIEKYGIRKGTFKSLNRISRCHPWNPGGYDPA